jgi:hypothetical protein
MRVVGWPRLLNNYVAQVSRRASKEPFKFGTFDCVHLAADWVHLCTGVDPLADYRGKYGTKEEAQQLVGDGLLQRLTEKLGEPIHPSHGQRGDIALRVADGSCGILFTSGARMRGLFLSESSGLVMHRLQDIDYVFRV